MMTTIAKINCSATISDVVVIVPDSTPRPIPSFTLLDEQFYRALKKTFYRLRKKLVC